MRCLLVLVGGLLLSAQAAAGPWQDWDTLRRQAADFLLEQAAENHPGSKAQVEMGAVDPRLRFPACPTPEFFLPPGNRGWGNGNLGVRCTSPEPWSLYIGYQVRLSGPALVAKRPLAARAPLAAADWEIKEVDYANDPGAYPRDLRHFPGATLVRPVVAGTPLAIDMLRRPQVVRSGQRVRVVVEGSGFQISQEGIAQNNAHAGEIVKVKLDQKHFVQGTAQADGTIEVRP
jgi:flagella basal body P-ring formation protein FlgA